MKNIRVIWLVGCLIFAILLSSCTRNQLTKPSVTSKTVVTQLPTIKKEKHERFIPYIIAAVIVIIAETTGQKTTTTTTTTTANGTQTTTVTECHDLGVCAGSIALSPQSGLGTGTLNLSDQSFELHTDLLVNAKLAITQSKDIILLVEKGQNSEEVTNDFFYGEYLYLFPDSYKIDNPKVLKALGLKVPFVIQGANYPVYKHGSMKYIIVGNQSQLS